MVKSRKIVFYTINSVIVVATTFIMANYLFGDTTNPLSEATNGINALRAFTNLSNIFAAAVALLLIFFPSCPNWLRRLQFASTTAVFLTFVVVVFFLNPLFFVRTGEPLLLFADSMFFTHLLTPFLSIIVFAFLTPSKYKFRRRDFLVNLIPVFCYGVVYFLNVLAFQTWPDFYNFTFGGNLIFVPIVVLAIFGLTLGLSWILSIMTRKRR